MRRIGIYSGTFDPVHYGHIAFAASAIRACNLDEVVFLPEPQPRYKAGVTDIAHRLALLTMATAAQSNLT
ncbi:MAG TPA: adenylyltransferase/cytidyltransferase family protein, partial [Candidatus Saccharimonadales bacterium]|nr:adenylyltransferase/cytidyltransferase family protein [Candidatus Saccharimonadales bacterium]